MNSPTDDCRSFGNFAQFWDVLVDHTMDQVQTDATTVVTAKALIVGDSGVGKSGLASRLDQNTFKPTASTHGAYVSHIDVPAQVLDDSAIHDKAAEIELWDLGGQPDYNLVHQLFMPGSHTAVIAIDELSEDALSSVSHWVGIIDAHCPDVHAKLLVSARIDRGRSQLDDRRIQACAASLGLRAFIRTSAFSGQGIDELAKAIVESVDWRRLPWRTTPGHWREVEHIVRSLARSEVRILPIDEVERRLAPHSISRPEILTIMSLMHQRGQIFLLQPRPDSQFVLLDPSLLNRYGSSVILAARSNAERPGTVAEASVLRGDLGLTGFERLPVRDERIVLDAVVSLLLSAGACKRSTGTLEFPSQMRGPVTKCFLSHNGADKPLAEDIGRRLLDKGIDVWLDKWEMLAGESLTSRIEEGIDGASAFIILMSPRSMKAKWVREELRIALQRRLADPEFALIPVLLEDCEIPAFLRDYIYVDWRSQTDDAFDFLLSSLRRTKRKPQRVLAN